MPVRVPLIFGTMTMGEAGKGAVRTTKLSECQQILDVFFKHGHTELDTARVYAAGTTKEYLGQLDLKNAILDTKQEGGHKPAAVREALLTSLKALKRHKVRVFYLHAPDANVAFEETCEEVDKLYKEGLFEIFGLSNYAAWQVAEIVNMCRERGWVQPKVYQAMYNAIMRGAEPELVPCLHKYDIRLVVYNPLAGGLLAGKILSATDELPEGRFKGESMIASGYRARYLKHGYFDAINHIKAVADKHGLRMTEIALRWCQHHGALAPTDGIIFGATGVAQAEANCLDSEKGPLPQEAVDALDEAWVKVGHSAPSYWQ